MLVLMRQNLISPDYQVLLSCMMVIPLLFVLG